MIAKKITWITILLFVILLIVTVFFFLRHSKLQEMMDYSAGMIRICNRQIERITGKWNTSEDTGEEFIDAGHAYSADLDIVGEKSLFQFLNAAHTWHGRRAFADDLLWPGYDSSELLKRQEAIAELSKDLRFSCKIQHHLSYIGADSSADKLLEELRNNRSFFKHKICRDILTVLPVFTIVLLCGNLILQKTGLYLTGIVTAVLQAFLWMLGTAKTKKHIGVMMGLPYKLGEYHKVIQILTDRNFSSGRLVQMKEQLGLVSQAVKKLGRIAERVNIRHNGVLYTLANIFLLWDYQCVFLLEKWKAKNLESAAQCFQAVGEFESLLCFAGLPNICGNTCLPIISEKGVRIDARNLGHPLLPNESRVNNDFRLENDIFIISGSNMSGKTTFLRTVGINLVLARAGGFVCASRMTCSLPEIMTSMRITDDLNEGVSTFYAELNRIKRILDSAKSNPDMIFLIDEIFRGTNSADRLTGAGAVLLNLSRTGAAGMISTHDLELCDLAKLREKIRNYSFSEYYEDGNICFDYKMKSGVGKTTNAKYLMEMVGISLH